MVLVTNIVFERNDHTGKFSGLAIFYFFVSPCGKSHGRGFKYFGENIQVTRIMYALDKIGSDLGSGCFAGGIFFLKFFYTHGRYV